MGRSRVQEGVLLHQGLKSFDDRTMLFGGIEGVVCACLKLARNTRGRTLS